MIYEVLKGAADSDSMGSKKLYAQNLIFENEE